MAGATSISQLKNILSKNIKQVMTDEKGVPLGVELEMKKSIKYKVYDVYDPRVYSRRTYGEGGLLNSKSYDTEPEDIPNGGTRIKVSNTAKRDDRYGDYSRGYLTPLIVYGHGGSGGEYSYEYKNPSARYLRPRDFVSETRRRLKTSKTHVNMLQIGLEDRGIETTLF
jgi:hypothetical protein